MSERLKIDTIVPIIIITFNNVVHAHIKKKAMSMAFLCCLNTYSCCTVIYSLTQGSKL